MEAMEDLVIHDLDPELRRRLEQRAELHGHTASAEAKAILREALPAAAPESALKPSGLGSRLRAIVAEAPLTDEEFAIFEQAWTTERKNARMRPPPFSEEDDGH